MARNPLLRCRKVHYKAQLYNQRKLRCFRLSAPGIFPVIGKPKCWRAISSPVVFAWLIYNGFLQKIFVRCLTFTVSVLFKEQERRRSRIFNLIFMRKVGDPSAVNRITDSSEIYGRVFFMVGYLRRLTLTSCIETFWSFFFWSSFPRHLQEYRFNGGSSCIGCYLIRRYLSGQLIRPFCKAR